MPNALSALELTEEIEGLNKITYRYKPSKELLGVIAALDAHAQDVPSSDWWNYYQEELKRNLKRIETYKLEIANPFQGKSIALSMLCGLSPDASENTETLGYDWYLKFFDAGPKIDWSNIDPDNYQKSEREQVYEFVSAYNGFYGDVNIMLKSVCSGMMQYLFDIGLADSPLFAALEKMHPGDRELLENWAAQSA